MKLRNDDEKVGETDEHGDPVGPEQAHGHRDRHADFRPSAPAVGPDGAPLPLSLDPPRIPEATPANMICLRGPCRHFMHLIGTAEIGNPRGTFDEGKEPRQHYRFCMVFKAEPLDMEDDVVFECNHWDPVDADDAGVLARNRRREKYLASNPVPVVADLDDDIDDVVQGYEPAEAKPATAQLNFALPVGVTPPDGTPCHPPSDCGPDDASLRIQCALCGGWTFLLAQGDASDADPSRDADRESAAGLQGPAQPREESEAPRDPA